MLTKLSGRGFGALALAGALLASGWPGFAQDKPAAAKQPTAKEILLRFQQAIGGAEEFAKRKSQRAVGTVSMPAQQLSGKMEVFAARPNKLLVKIEMPGIGQITTGFDGKVGWLENPLTGAMLLPEKVVTQMAAQADFDHPLHKPEDYTTLEVLGAEDFEGEACYKLQLVHKTGYTTTEYFSRETGLQKGFFSKQENPLGGGEIQARSIVTEYKRFGGMLVPSKVVQELSGIQQVLTITEMDFDHVPPETFALPAGVKPLLEKQP